MTTWSSPTLNVISVMPPCKSVITLASFHLSARRIVGFLRNRCQWSTGFEGIPRVVPLAPYCLNLSIVANLIQVYEAYKTVVTRAMFSAFPYVVILSYSSGKCSSDL